MSVHSNGPLGRPGPDDGAVHTVPSGHSLLLLHSSTSPVDSEPDELSVVSLLVVPVPADVEVPSLVLLVVCVADVSVPVVTVAELVALDSLPPSSPQETTIDNVTP